MRLFDTLFSHLLPKKQAPYVVMDSKEWVESPRTKLLLAKARARWDRKDTFLRQNSYMDSHSPWDLGKAECVNCGLSDLEITANGWYCPGKISKRGLTATEAFMRYEEQLGAKG